MDQLRFANPREESATRFLLQRAVETTTRETDTAGLTTWRGAVKDQDKTFQPSLTVDRDQRMVRAECTCNWHRQHKLFQGPCEHILALRMQSARRRN
jgi:hypothetical protein